MTPTHPDTLAALKGSIEKWERIVAGTGRDYGANNCALCDRFPSCIGCPVMEKTGLPSCENSPYDDWRMAGGCCAETADTPDLKRLAEAELAFLKSLLPEDAAPQPTAPTRQGE